MYFAWQQENDPTRFVHFFIFENEAAHKVHSQSVAVKRFEAAYRPELDGGDVVFTDYRMVSKPKLNPRRCKMGNFANGRTPINAGYLASCWD
jgi:hypothetical protein